MDYSTFSEAVVKNVLLSEGGTWAPEKSIKEFLKTKGGNFTDFVSGMKAGSNEVLCHENFYTSSDIGDKETNVAQNITRLIFCGSRKIYPRPLIDKYIKEYEDKTGMKFHFSQADAIATLCNSPGLGVLIGGPGTGKTTTVQCVLYCKRKLAKGACAITLTAPTGKAANRLAESTGENTCTLHKKVLTKAFPEDVLVVDEASMIDLDLADELFRLVPSGKDVILIGDTEQLPSVGKGAILRDIINSGVVPIARLTKTFRQDNSSKLFTCISNIKAGIADIPNAGREGDVHPIVIKDDVSKEEAERLAEYATLKCYKAAVDKYGADNVACLLPYRKSGFCSMAINPKLQNMCNPENANNQFCGYRLNDLVIQLVNRPECANGDVGKVIDVSADSITVKYTDSEVSYSASEIKEQLSLAYAMTIHKSQGSEYKHVIVVLLNEHEAMQQKNLIYTGITRAKKECTVIYQKSALETSVLHAADEKRHTFLAEKIRAYRENYRLCYGL